MPAMADAPKVFISYSHDSETHKERVLALSDRLREDGLDCEIDQYEEAPPEGWPRWMNGRIAWADYVLIVCSEVYAQRFTGVGERGRGKGAKWEGAIITQELHDAEALNVKYVPIVMSAADVRCMPSILAGSTYYDLSQSENYDNLYRRLTGQPRIKKRAVGAIREMPPLERKAAAPWAASDAPTKPVTPSTPSQPERTLERPSSTLLEKEALIALLDSANALNEKDTLEEVLVDLLLIAGRLIEASAGSVLLHDPEKQDLYFVAATGPKRDELANRRVPIADSKAGDVFQSGRTLVESTVVGHYSEIDRETEFTTRSMICVPLAHREKRYGVMQMLNKQDGRAAFNGRDVELFTRFAVHASIALHKARLLEQMISSSGMYAASEVRRDLLKLLTEPGRGAVKERLSVLAVDMRHFTRLCDELRDPERIQGLLSEYITMLASIAVEHSGIVHKIAGDGLYALFRGPSGAHNAVRTAQAMTRAFDALAARWRRELGLALAYVDLGIGIATSDDMILGTVGNERFRDFTIIGSAVNLAAPLVKAARNGERILCDEATWMRVKDSGDLCAKGPRIFAPKEPVGGVVKSYPIYQLQTAGPSA
jgi:class 3 adenylate cyclase